MSPNNFKNVNVKVRIELAEVFQDAFEQSGANSKGEFFGNLLENYLNPDHDSKLKDRKEMIENLEIANAALREQVQDYERSLQVFNDKLIPILENHIGENVEIKDSETGAKKTIEINSIDDVFQVIMNSVKIN